MSKTKEAKKIELNAKEESYFKAIDTILDGKADGLLGSLIKDFTPDEKGKKRGLSFGSILKATGFTFSHPRTTLNLIRLVRDKNDPYLKPEFQKKLLEKTNLWKKIDRHAKDLPILGKVLNGFDVKLFKKDSILNQNALERIGSALKNKDTLERLKNIAITARSGDLDWKKLTADGLETIAKDENFKKLFAENELPIKQYIAGFLINDVDPKQVGEFIKKTASSNPEYKKINEMFQKDPNDRDVFKEELSNLVVHNINNPKNIKAIEEVQGFQALSEVQRDQLKILAEEAISSLTPPVQKAYNLSGVEMRALSGIVPILLKEPEKLQKTFDLLMKENYKDMVIDLLTNKEVVKYFEQNKDNFSKIITLAIESNPSLKSYAKGATKEISALADTILSKPESIKELLESFEKGKLAMAYAGTKFIAQNLLDAKFREALYGSIKGWIFSGDSAKEKLANEFLRKASDKAGGENFSLKEFVEEGIKTANLPEQDIEKLNRHILFDNINIKGAKDNPLDLGNLSITDLTFTNSSIENVYFRNATFNNAGFNGASFKNVKFDGAVIDRNTLESLLPEVKKGNISLENTILTGNLSGIDFSKISLKGADLSRVTSMDNLNLKETTLTDAKLPKNLLKDTLNLSQAVGKITESEKSDQRECLTTKISKAVGDSLRLDETKKSELKNKLDLVIKNGGEIGKYLEESLQSTPKDLIDKKFSTKKDPKNFSDYHNTTSDTLNTILNCADKDDIGFANAIAVKFLADKATTELFGQGDNRGEDGLTIRNIATKALLGLKDKKIDLNEKNFQTFIEDFTETLKAQTKYTTAGKVTGGIYLPKETNNEAFIKKVENLMKQSFDKNALSEKEVKSLRNLSNKIGENLFAEGYKTDRKQDTNLIFQSLKEVFHQIKSSGPNKDIEKIIESQKDKDLTKLFQDNSTRTTAGLLTGGIYLQEKNINNESFKKKLNELSTKDLSPILQARDIGQKLNQSLRQSSDFELIKNNTQNRKNSKTLNL